MRVFGYNSECYDQRTGAIVGCTETISAAQKSAMRAAAEPLRADMLRSAPQAGRTGGGGMGLALPLVGLGLAALWFFGRRGS